jgi:hypothetical protein
VSGTQSVTCDEATPGFYVNHTGAIAPTACAEGTSVSYQKATACQQCVAGKYVDATGQFTCKFTSAGYYTAVNGSTSQSSCVSGTYSANSGQTACERCADGYTSAAGSAICSKCEAGLYTNGTDASPSCQPCPAGKFGVNGVTCQSCPAGQISTGGAVSCTYCNAGYYAADSGLSSCLPCPIKTAGTDSTRITCPLCAGTSFSDVEALRACKSCSTGQYAVVSLNGTATCKSCPDGAQCSAVGVVANANFYLSVSSQGIITAFYCQSDVCSSSDSGGTGCVTSNTSGVVTTSCCGLNRAPASENPLCGRLTTIQSISSLPLVLNSWYCMYVGRCLDGYSECKFIFYLLHYFPTSLTNYVFDATNRGWSMCAV